MNIWTRTFASLWLHIQIEIYYKKNHQYVFFLKHHYCLDHIFLFMFIYFFDGIFHHLILSFSIPTFLMFLIYYFSFTSFAICFFFIFIFFPYLFFYYFLSRSFQFFSWSLPDTGQSIWNYIYRDYEVKVLDIFQQNHWCHENFFSFI